MIKRIKLKSLYIFSLLIVTMSSVRGEVVSDVGNGGSIAASTLGTGIMNIIKDITGTLQWIIPVTGVGVILWCIFKIMTGDEQDNVRYKKNLIKTLICVVAGLIAVTIVNLVAKYFGK